MDHEGTYLFKNILNFEIIFTKDSLPLKSIFVTNICDIATNTSIQLL